MFFAITESDAKSLGSARKAVRTLGASVVSSVAGTLLVEADPGQLKDIAHALPNWRYTPERKTTRVPERNRLGRAKLAAAKD